jgi:hypothetical protein
LSTCKENQITETDNSFSGITVRDELGNVYSVDPDDWKNDPEWAYNNIYNSLKDSIKVFQLPDSLDNSLRPKYFQIDAFPNPCSSYIEINYAFPTFCEAFIVIIDNSLNVVRKIIMSYSSPGFHGFNFSLLDEKGNPLKNGIYRCIYRFEDKMTGEHGIYNGHGDIEIKK